MLRGSVRRSRRVRRRGGRVVKIRLEIDLHPDDGPFAPEAATEGYWRRVVARAFPYMLGREFDVTILPEAPDAPSADPAVAVPDEALASA